VVVEDAFELSVGKPWVVKELLVDVVRAATVEVSVAKA